MRTIVSIFAVFALVAVFITSMGLAASNAYLSDLPFQPAGLKYVNSSYFDGIRVNSHQTITTMSGSQYYSWDRPIQINGQEYDKAVLFHVVHDETVQATWSLNRRYSALTAMIGLDDTQDMPGIFPHIMVRFIGDHKTLGTTSFQSVYGTPNPTPSVHINVAGVNSLTVVVTMTGTGGGTNLDIVNPQLLGGNELATNTSTSSTEQQAQLAQRRAEAQAKLRILTGESQKHFLAYKSKFQLEQIDRHIKLVNAALQHVSCDDCRTILLHNLATAASLRDSIAVKLRPVEHLPQALGAPRIGGNVPSNLNEFGTSAGGLHVLGGPEPSPNPSPSEAGSAAHGSQNQHAGPISACQPPVITPPLSVSQGQPGDPISINGSGFGNTTAIVRFIGNGTSQWQVYASYTSPTELIASVPDITGVQAFLGYLYVLTPPCQQGMSEQKSNAVQFQFNPDIEPIQLPISAANAAWGSYVCGVDTCASFPGFGSYCSQAAPYFGSVNFGSDVACDAVVAGSLTGKRGDDDFFSGYQLINGFVVSKVDLTTEYAVNGSNGCSIKAGGIVGITDPYVDVHCWDSPVGQWAGYVLSISIEGPVGVPYQ
jgi:NPCBM/NEW2 domain